MQRTSKSALHLMKSTLLSTSVKILHMIYLDISAAVHSRAGLGRYAEKLAHALMTANPDAYGLFYNQGKDGRFPTSLTPFNRPQRYVSWGYKPWRMAILLAQLGHIPFNRLAP
ncbi:MAG: hypothetical protein KC421_15060, partial [Anaerolineales bacterium]|nr:hypothetical protein [Anaerolineales bacterium]